MENILTSPLLSERREATALLAQLPAGHSRISAALDVALSLQVDLNTLQGLLRYARALNGLRG